MNNCIKTGAYVYFADYDMYSHADLYAIGNYIVVHWNVHGASHEAHREVSHQMNLGTENYHNKDSGISVVPAWQICAVGEG